MTVLWLQKVQFSEQIFVLKSPPIANLQNVTDEGSVAYEFPDNPIGKWYTIDGTKSYDIILTIVK